MRPAHGRWCAGFLLLFLSFYQMHTRRTASAYCLRRGLQRVAKATRSRGNPFLPAYAGQKFLPPGIPLGTKLSAEPRTRRKAARTLSALNFPVGVPTVRACRPVGTFLTVCSLRLLPQVGAVLHTKYPARLAFFPQLCYNLCSFILTKRRRAATPSRMRTNRGRHTAHQRELPPQARRGASSPAHAPPPTTAERRGEPLPGAPVTAQREARPAGGAIRVEPWSGPAEREQRRFIPCRLSAG